MTSGKGSKYREFYALSGRITCMGIQYFGELLNVGQFCAFVSFIINDQLTCKNVSDKDIGCQSNLVLTELRHERISFITGKLN